MKKVAFAVVLGALVAVLSRGFAQEAAPKAAPAVKPKMIVTAAENLKYGPLPAQFVSGKPSVETSGTMDVAVVAGDPAVAGPFTVYARCSDGYKIAPHWHPTTENVTVLEGGMGIGMGSKWDSSALKSLTAHSFFSVPPGMRHYAQCNGDTLIEVSGNGPFKFNFVSAAPAAPAKKAPAKKAEEK